ncbi:RNA chaperone Hfq [Noviherbaspirillum pedocola]|nr:RNA chaperone Hfq [Noviherbaspirillum pedocola]
MSPCCFADLTSRSEAFSGETGCLMDQSLQNLQNQFLKELRENKTPISIFLVNGVRLHGCVEFFDNYVVAVRSEVTQLGTR